MSLIGRPSSRQRLPMTLQAEAAECGLACLSMIAAYHGHGAGPAELRRRFGMSLKGATLKEVIGIADRLGLAARPIRLELQELDQLRTPCILHWDLNHFVVLKAVGRGSVTIHDPADGVRRLGLAEVSRHFTGVALELTPTGGFQATEGPRPRVRMRSLVGRIVGLRRALGHLLLLAFAIEVFALLSPLFLGLTVDHAILAADRDLLLTLALAFGLLLLLQTGVEALRGWLLMSLGASLKVQARTNLLSHLIALPAAWFETRAVADILSRFDSQDEILRAITRDLVVAVLDGLMCVVTLVVMGLLAPMLTLLVVAGGLLYALLRWAFYAPLRQASAEALVWAARRDGHFLESLRGIRAIKLFNAQVDRRTQWLNLLVETINRQLVTERLSILFRAGNMLLLGGLGILVIWLAAQMIMDGTFTVGLLIAFVAYQTLFLRRVSGLIDILVDLRMLGLHAERLSDIALTPPEPPGGLAEPAPRTPVAIEVRDLGFRYGPNDPWVLHDLSFRIEAGEWVAIAGPSGCGKTTLLKLLAGLLQPTHGEILVGGQMLDELGPARWRDMIGVVMQDDTLFAGSIADNIAFFAPEPDRTRIEDYAQLAAVHDDIARMPMGYATLIGDMGNVLSGGQQQRILLARALYKRPRLLLLDEATSHLDIARERAVNEALGTMPLTRITIAHRPETIHAAGRVIALDGGRLVEPAAPRPPPTHERAGQDHAAPAGGGLDAAGQRRRDLLGDREDRLLLRPQPAGAGTAQDGNPAVVAPEPVF